MSPPLHTFGCPKRVTVPSLKWTHRLLLRLAALANCYHYALLKIGVTVAVCI